MFLEKLLILLQVKNINNVILFFVFFLYSCSNFEFVYKNNEINNELSIQEIIVAGSNAGIIKKTLSNKFLSNEGSKKYTLSVNSKWKQKVWL